MIYSGLKVTVFSFFQVVTDKTYLLYNHLLLPKIPLEYLKIQYKKDH